MEAIVVEIARFRLAEGTSPDAFVAEASAVQESFLSERAGFLDRELLADGEGAWTDIVHWASLAQAQDASAAMLEDTSCQRFIAMIDPESVSMSHLNRVQTWS